jgi:putative protease
MPNAFSSFLIDLRDIKTETNIQISKTETIKLFEEYLENENQSADKIRDSITNTTCEQYRRGI